MDEQDAVPTPAEVPASVSAAVLVQSKALPPGHPVVSGYDFNEGIDYEKLLEAMATTGFQAMAMGQAVQEVRRMLSWRYCPTESAEGDERGESTEDTDALQGARTKVSDVQAMI